jgi:hypothetical protein
MVEKYIICSGCSFTRQLKRLGLNGTDTDFLEDDFKFWRWPHHIQKKFPHLKVYNLGNPTNDNGVIAHSVMKKITDLIEDGVNPKNIKVIIQWSDQNRNSFFISNKIADINNSKILDIDETDLTNNGLLNFNKWAHLSAFAEENYFDKKKWGYYLLTGGYSVEHINYIKDIINIHSKYVSNEESSIRFFTNIILIQNFCKINNISDIFMFNLSYNFIIEHEPKYYEKIQNVYINKKIPQFISEFKTNNPYISYLYKNIDFENFWFFKNEYTNVGGQLEWAVSEFDFIKDKRLFMEHDYVEGDLTSFCLNNQNTRSIGHVSSEMNSKFVNNILNPFLEK